MCSGAYADAPRCAMDVFPLYCALAPDTSIAATPAIVAAVRQIHMERDYIGPLAASAFACTRAKALQEPEGLE